MLCYFSQGLSQMVFDRMPRRSEQERLELVGASGASGLDSKSHSKQYLGTASGSNKEDSLLRNEQRHLAAM